jgi:hypothetical protein
VRRNGIASRTLPAITDEVIERWFYAAAHESVVGHDPEAV